MSKEDKHAHDKFRKDALKAIKEGRLEKAKHSYEAWRGVTVLPRAHGPPRRPPGAGL